MSIFGKIFLIGESKLGLNVGHMHNCDTMLMMTMILTMMMIDARRAISRYLVGKRKIDGITPDVHGSAHLNCNSIKVLDFVVKHSNRCTSILNNKLYIETQYLYIKRVVGVFACARDR